MKNKIYVEIDCGIKKCGRCQFACGIFVNICVVFLKKLNEQKTKGKLKPLRLKECIKRCKKRK